jgi:SAM-dependent methyltransferase
MRLSYHHRLFTSVANSSGGDVDGSTRFHYHHTGDVVWATYSGGAVLFGTLLARVQDDDSLEMRYHHITSGGTLKAGRCVSKPEILADGRLRLHERWEWTEGDESSGQSIVEEMRPSDTPLALEFGHIDIYLFDQILRGRISQGMRIFDTGCGSGRNLVYFLREGFDAFGVDADAAAIEAVRELAQRLAPRLPPSNFRSEAIEATTFPADFADVVISSAVLHFARDDEQFTAMLDRSWRALRPGGLFFCRLASSIGMEGRMRPVAGRRCLLPDGSERYVVDEPLLLEKTAQLGGRLLDPLKTTVVQNQRAMTTWVVRKVSE